MQIIQNLKISKKILKNWIQMNMSNNNSIRLVGTREDV